GPFGDGYALGEIRGGVQQVACKLEVQSADSTHRGVGRLHAAHDLAGSHLLEQREECRRAVRLVAEDDAGAACAVVEDGVHRCRERRVDGGGFAQEQFDAEVDCPQCGDGIVLSDRVHRIGGVTCLVVATDAHGGTTSRELGGDEPHALCWCVVCGVGTQHAAADAEVEHPE